MKRCFLCILVLMFSVAFFCCNSKAKTSLNSTISKTDTGGIDLPKPNSYVSDLENLFTSDQQNILDSIINSNEKQTTNEICIVTLDSTMIGGSTLEEFAINLGNKWGVGKKEKDNGIVIAICNDLHKITIRNSKGIEAIFSDAETKAIIDNIIIPEYKKGNHFEGTRDGLLAIIEKIKAK